MLATIGSAIGIGSIWKFPYEVGANGGGAFVVVYVAGLGAECVEKELHEEHAAELRELLSRAGIGDADPAEFRRYGSARRLYNFHVDNAY